MIIKESDFELRPLSDSSNFYDLYVLVTINEKKGTARQELKVIAYGCTLASAINRIARYRMFKKDANGVYTMKQYLDSLNKEIKELYKVVNETPSESDLME